MAKQVHTQFAMKALDLAGIFNAIVGPTPVASTEGGPFSVELATPDGPSTGGGTQSVQHIKLTRGDLVLVAGAADQIAKTAELRSYDYVAALHAQRFKGEALPIDRKSYDDFVKRARDVFANQSLTIVMREAVAAPSQVAPAQSRTGLFVVGVLVALVVGAVAYYLTLR